MHRGHSWLCPQELPLAVLREPYGMLGIEPRLAVCKANAVPIVLLLHPLILFLLEIATLRIEH